MALGKVEEEGVYVSIMVGTDGTGWDQRVHLDCSLNGRSEPPAKAARLSSMLFANGQDRNIHTLVISNLQYVCVCLFV